MTLMAVAFSTVSIYATAHRFFTTPFSLPGFLIGQLAYPAATVIAVFSYRVALAIYAAIAAFYIAFPLIREAQLRRSPP